jgi:hypothetical protein
MFGAVCTNTYSVMGENGSYVQDIPFTIIIPLKYYKESPEAPHPVVSFTKELNFRKYPDDNRRIEVVFHTKYRYWINKYGLADYLEETIAEQLTENARKKISV